MRSQFNRWYVWLAVLLLVGLVASTAFIYSCRGRITQTNFDRIQNGMTKEEITAILGDEMPPLGSDAGFSRFSLTWTNGPNWINVSFDNRKAYEKSIHIASAWETVQWYVRRATQAQSYP